MTLLSLIHTVRQNLDQATSALREWCVASSTCAETNADITDLTNLVGLVYSELLYC